MGRVGLTAMTLSPTPSARFLWLQKVREQQARQERIRHLRAELAAARAAGKAERHRRRMAQQKGTSP